MSNFSGHAVGGVVASGIIGVAATINQFPLKETINIPILSLIVFLFSLFPDLDIASIPQRWYYRIGLVILCVLCFCKLFEWACIFSIVSFVPLIHKHRGITHSFIFSLIFPCVLSLLIELYVFDNKTISIEIIHKYCIYIIGACIGWWTHLLLDLKS